MARLTGWWGKIGRPPELHVPTRTDPYNFFPQKNISNLVTLFTRITTFVFMFLMSSFEGIALGHAAADRAAASCGEEWRREAMEAFVRYARAHKRLTSEDVRLANPQIVTPGDARAWGHIAKAACKAGVVVKVGYARCVVPKVHSSVTTLWESLIA